MIIWQAKEQMVKAVSVMVQNAKDIVRELSCLFFFG